MWIRNFILLSSILSSQSWATDSCLGSSFREKSTKNVDLRNEMSPLRDQDSIGWCYSFTAADLWGHFLLKNPKSIRGLVSKYADFTNKNYRVSAIGIATYYNKNINPGYLKAIQGKRLDELTKQQKKVVAEEGIVQHALDIIKKEGFCFEKDLSSEDYSLVEDSRCAKKGHCQINEILNMVYEIPSENMICQDLINVHKIFGQLDFATIKKILISTERENALTRLVEASCNKKLIKPLLIGSNGPSVVSYNVEGGHKVEDMMKSMDNHLDRGIPVAIHYYSAFLTGTETKSSHHASTIVGKRFNPKTCEVEYILRNSWGQGCGHYQSENPKFNKCLNGLKTNAMSTQNYFNGLIACRKNNPPQARNPRVVCEESSGYVFIRKSDMQKYVYATTVLEEDEITF